MIVSEMDVSVGESADTPVGDSSQPLPGDYRSRQLARSATMTALGSGNPHYQPPAQGPFPWSSYQLHRTDEAIWALDDIELHQLSEDASGRETAWPERELDLSD